MKVVHITDTNTAYMPAMFVHLINTYSKGNQAFLLQQKPFLFGNPLGIANASTVEEITEILDNADVLHFHGSTVFDSRKFLGIKLDKWMNTKKFVLHYHGTPQREKYLQYRRSVPLLVSTPEMLPLFPGSRFFPNLIDERLPMYAKRTPPANGKFSICHHFSYHRAAKNTNDFLRCSAQEPLQKKYDFVFLERCSLDEALAKRAQNQVVFDHLQGYYGLVSLEGMLQGLAVVNGCSKDTLAHVREFFGSIPPFLICPKEVPLERYLLELKPEQIQEAQKKGPEFMRNVWSGAKNIARLIEVYKGL